MSKTGRAVGSVVAAAAFLAAGLYAGTRVTSSKDAAAHAKPPPLSIVTATLENRTLTTDVVARGSKAAGGGYRITARAAASPDAVVTSIQTHVGDVLTEGAVIADVSGQPLITAALAFPLYRDVAAGDRGPDVDELGAYLVRLGALGSAPMAADAAFAAGMRAVLADRGYPTLIPTDAKRFALPRRWFTVVDHAGRHVTRVAIRVGSTLDDSATLLVECDVSAPSVVAHLDHDGARRVRVGDAAMVSDDNQNNVSLPMRVLRIGTAPADAPDGVPVTLTSPDRAVVDSLSPNLTVTITAQVAAKPVLVVPVSGVFTRQDGTSHVELAATARTSAVDVTLGPCVSGWCQIARSARPLHAGDRVVVARQPDS